MFALHLPPDAVDVLGSTGDFCVDPVIPELFLQRRLHFRDETFAFGAFLPQCAGDRFIGFGIGEAEGEVFQLPFQLPDAQAIRQRRIDFTGFHGQGHSVLRRCLFGVPQPVDLFADPGDDESGIGNHGQQHLAQSLGLLCGQRFARAPVCRQREAPELHESLDQFGELGVPGALQRPGVEQALAGTGIEPDGRRENRWQLERFEDRANRLSLATQRVAARFTVESIEDFPGARDDRGVPAAGFPGFVFEYRHLPWIRRCAAYGEPLSYACFWATQTFP